MKCSKTTAMQDREILRELARRVREIAADPAQEERQLLWYKINRLERCRIPVLLAMHNLYWQEVVPDSALRTSGSLARNYERRLRLQIWQWENVDDDWVTEPVVEYDTVVRYPRCISTQIIRPDTETLGAYHTEPVILAESDIDKIIIDRECRVDWDATARNREWAETVFDGILTPVRAQPNVGTGPFDYVCEIRGMEQVFMDMIERPDWLEEVMRRLYQLNLEVLTHIEREGALTLNNTFQRVYNGGLGYTDELPAAGFDPDHVRLKDVWGFSLAQSSVSISPEMHERFITQFDRNYDKRFGLTAIACCETVDKKMHLYRTLAHLRRISISAWNDFALAAQAIGEDYIYSLKPSAVSIAQPTWNVEQDMAYLADILKKSQPCHVEIIHNEIATCHNHPERLAQWAQHAKRLVSRWEP